MRKFLTLIAVTAAVLFVGWSGSAEATCGPRYPYPQPSYCQTTTTAPTTVPETTVPTTVPESTTTVPDDPCEGKTGCVPCAPNCIPAPSTTTTVPPTEVGPPLNIEREPAPIKFAG